MRNILLGGSVILAALTLALGSRAETEGAQRPLDTPLAVYSAACSSCHGDDGRGRSRERVGFDVGLPDFTDCTFATREPDGDWFAVTHQGGPIRGFDHRMPAFGEALSEDQMRLAIEHVRTFCGDDAWPSGNLNQARPMFTEKAFVEDEFVFTFGAAVQEPYAVDAELLLETRIGARSQLELIVPFAGVDLEPVEGDPGSGGWTGGIGDIAVGVKHVLLAAESTGSILSAIAEIITPTGDADRDLGKGVFVFEPTLTFGQLLGPAGFLHLQLGMEVPAENDPGTEALWRLAYGYTFTQGMFGRAWSPMIEVLGNIDIEEGATPHWDLAPQIQITLSARQHIALALATRIPLEPGHDRTIGVWAYFLWEWFDGGLAEGW
ncbi:MAG: cytochrome c [Myxococcales bacterium]|nr:cytochrome c [Myxococcales bacterium]